MTREELVKALWEGKKLSKKEWHIGSYIYKLDDKIINQEKETLPFGLITAITHPENFHIYEEPKEDILEEVKKRLDSKWLKSDYNYSDHMYIRGSYPYILRGSVWVGNDSHHPSVFIRDWYPCEESEALGSLEL